MSVSFTGAFKIAVVGNLSNSPDLGATSYNLNYNKSYSISNGTTADSANMIWTDTRTIAASGTDDIDLAGSIMDQFGDTITFTKIKGILVSASSSNTNLVLVGGGSNAFINWIGASGDIIKVRPGGTFALYANDSIGYAVTASTADILEIANSSSGTSVTYDIALIGCV